MRREQTCDEMALQTNSIDLDTSPLELFHKVQSCSGLVVRRLDVVVVVVELHAQTLLCDRLLSGGKCHRHILGPDVGQPNVASIASSRIIGESLIDNIPAVAVVTKVLDEVGNMVL